MREAWPSDEWDFNDNQGAWFISTHRYNIAEYDERDY